ncbi:FtsQ-type POTRA domain-containing protein [Hyalangium versicolor]|uniref:FtsQ-type POTRA domain-containing protein n=1 Tax=Hyalangium versicolor TaxID=2861190 RepID=UPI001CCF0B60|nr:FtsQ-type POTRA domain-containing protein [Hyalangium versicolor]
MIRLFRRVCLVAVLHGVGFPGLASAQEPQPEPLPVPAPGGLEVEAQAAPPEEPTGRIERIEVSGNTRTRDSVILHALQTAPGDVFTASSGAELKRRVLNLRLFKSVEVHTRPEGTGVALQVQVEERWTLLPFPIFSSSEGQWQAGVFAVESNLFGLNKTLVFGGLAGNRGGSVISMYRDPGIAGSLWTGRLWFQFAKKDRERRLDDIVVDAYTDRRFDISGSLGYQLTSALNVGAGPFALTNKPLPLAGGAATPEPGEAYGVSLTAEYLGQDFHFYFNEGLAALVSYRQGLGFLGSSRELRQLSVFASYTLPLFGNHALTLAGSHIQGHGDPVLDAQLLGGRPGSRGFAQDTLWGDTVSTLTLEYQVPLWSPRLATVTAHAFVDVGRVQLEESLTRYAAPGVGFRVYLRSVAIPAVGVEVTRSPETGKLLPSVAVGFSM